jgi:hypothetical protein
MSLGIDIQAKFQTVVEAKKQIEMLGTSLKNVHGLSDLGDFGFDPSQSERVREMVTQVQRLNTIAGQGERKGGFLDKRQFQEASRMMMQLTKNVQDYGRELEKLKQKHAELGREERQLLNKISTGGGSSDDIRRRNEIRRQRSETGEEIDKLQRDEERVQRLRRDAMHAQNNIGGMGQESGGMSGIKKALGWALAAAGGFSILGFLSQSRAKYQQSSGHEATLGARGIKGGFGDNVGIGIGPLEQMAMIENLGQSAGLSGDKARGAANMSGAFGRAMGVDPNSVAGMYSTMYGASGNASYGSGAIGMMGEAIRKGMDKAKTTELMTLISRNTQITASAMHGAGTGNLAGASTALAIEAIMAQQNGASYGQFAKSQEFAGVMQNGLQGAGTGAGDIRLFSAMGGFNGPMTWEKIHEMNVIKQGGFLKSPELMSKIMGGLTGTDKAKAGQLETMFESWGIKGVSSEKMIEMYKGGFFDRLLSATKNGKRSIESLKNGSKEEKAVYEEYKKNAASLPGMGAMRKEALAEKVEIKVGREINEMFGKFKEGALHFADALANKDWKSAFKALGDTAEQLGPVGKMLMAGAAINLGASVMNAMPGGAGKAIAARFMTPALAVLGTGAGAYYGTQALLDFMTDGQYGKDTGNSYKPSGKSDLRYSAERYAKARGLDPSLVKAVITAESGWNPNATSKAGAKGLMQVMPEHFKYGENPYDPGTNTAVGTRILAGLMKKYNGDKEKALAAYNAGEERLDKTVAKYGDDWRKHMPEETRKYVPRVIRLEEAENGMHTEEYIDRHPSIGRIQGNRDKIITDKMQNAAPGLSYDLQEKMASEGPVKNMQWEMLNALRSIDSKIGVLPTSKPITVGH